MPGQPLHPNLGRVAAAYDTLVGQFATGELDAGEVNLRADTLIARDDQGVRWRIETTTGAWQRQLTDGRWVADLPPMAGRATLAAADLATVPGASLRTVTAYTVTAPAPPAITADRAPVNGQLWPAATAVLLALLAVVLLLT